MLEETFQIRFASEEDLPQIIELTKLVADKHGAVRNDILRQHPYHITEEKLKRDCSLPNHVQLVACDRDKIVGVMLCTIKDIVGDKKYKDVKLFCIEDTCVLEAYRNKHCGKQLIQSALKIAREAKCGRVETNVWSFNEESYRFFAANGFSVQRSILELNYDEHY